MKIIPTAALAVSLAALPAFAAEEHREQGAHQHGHGTLNIAIEGKRVSMELGAPGMDVTGFEHEAKSEEDKQAAAKAEGLLKDPLALFTLPAAAGCKALEVEVESGKPDGQTENDHASETGVTDANSADEAGHSEYSASYILECETPAALTAIDFQYFTAFPRAEELQVNLVTDKSQASFEVVRDKPALDISGSM